MTVASGRGLLVAELGRKIPEAVFYRNELVYAAMLQAGRTNCLRLEALNENAVEERDDGLDGPESCLGGLHNVNNSSDDGKADIP